MAALKQYYKGDDIKEPIIAWSDDDKTIPLDIENDTIDIIIRIYTDGDVIYKLSKTDKTSDGYVQLVKQTSYLYWLIIEGDKTALLSPGKIHIDVMTITTDAYTSDNRLNESDNDVLGIMNESTNKAEI